MVLIILMQKTMNVKKYPINILLDSCFWIAYFNQDDNHHNDARVWSENIFDYNIYCPFPTMYEFLNTRFSRNKYNQINEFNLLIKKGVINLIYDDDYRNNILMDFIELNKYYPKSSLVDIVINRMIDDIRLNIHYVFTYNPEDFIEICQKRNIELLPY